MLLEGGQEAVTSGIVRIIPTARRSWKHNPAVWRETAKLREIPLLSGQGRLCPGLAVEANLEPQRHEPLAKVLDRLGATADGLGDLGVGPRRTSDSRLQKALRAADLLRGTFELLDHLRPRGPFRIREPYDLLLLRGRTLRGCSHHAKNLRSTTP